jgi:hypothetical protein
MITVGTLAKMYGQLPSTVRDNATTYDLSVANVLISWENQQQDRANNRAAVPNAPQAPHLSQKELMAMIKNTRKDTDDKQSPG